MTASPPTIVAGGARKGPDLRQLIRTLGREKYLHAMMLLPMLYFLVFYYAPMYGITLAFKDFDFAKGIMGSPWVGLRYFREFFADPYSYKLIVNTLVLRTLYLTIAFPIPVILAILLNEIRHERFKRFVQSASYLPHFISLVVVSGMIIQFLSMDGFVNQIIKSMGGKAYPWMLDPKWFRPIWLVSIIWQETGWASIIFLAALTAINPELYEAALVDGANRWQRLIYITLPGIAPTVTIMFLLNVGRMLTVDYQRILLIYTGATYEVADVLGTYVYRRGILAADFSYATAVGVFQAAVGLVFLVGANTIAKRIGETSLF